ncbi:uncharacterized protein LOC124917861 [Impatiens glandulifera]|uniref:uncharacterized protein LOC124917861 n=1 Tax=Impatiens glandulifera TaxID=253017 RepID=UPI001FB188C3|nr:uncharacterized protein LOC124917861 [Impatiens glandulifera]
MSRRHKAGSIGVRKVVETIDLDLSSGTFNCRPISSYKQQYKLKYNFSLLKTDQSTSEKFGSLISLELQSVNITSLQLTKVLESCPLLEKLALHEISDHYTIQSDHLKILSLKCLVKTKIDLCANNLHTVQLIGPTEFFSLKNKPPRLLLKIFPEYIQIGKKEVIEKCPNGTITKLELNGFIGNQHQVDLLEYLLENLIGLKVLAIGPSNKIYKSFSCWDNEATIEEKNMFQIQSESLRKIISPSVRLVFL